MLASSQRLSRFEDHQTTNLHPEGMTDDYPGANRAVLTLNRIDFIRLHQETQGAHAGTIGCTRDDLNPLAFAERINAVPIAHPNPAGCLIRMVRPAC